MANFSNPTTAYSMPRDTAEFHSFISGRITETGDLAQDYKMALADCLAMSDAVAVKLSLQDVFKKWWDAGKPYP
jgi:hypothetical protein